ncbi:MAG TPA: hypothetical protein VJ464_16010 [Blastocatellia bacterium]|nr:hypothetical protein [Blastocatellia bacterium]
MTPDLVKIYLITQKITQTDIAKAINREPNEVGRTLSGERRNEKIRAEIEDFLGVKVFDVEFDTIVALRKSGTA